MNKPSEIYVSLDTEKEDIKEVRVGGYASISGEMIISI
jgi:predicted PhzF superfamily epimerase YddE/YHI9